MGFEEVVKRRKAETSLLTPQKRQGGEREMEDGKQRWETEKEKERRRK